MNSLHVFTMTALIQFFGKDILVKSFSFEQRFMWIESPGEFLPTQSLDLKVSLFLKTASMLAFLTRLSRVF